MNSPKPQPPSLSPSTSPIERLTEVMARLRNPNGGCPWDLEQNFKTIAPHTLEETYEVIEAIERDDMPGLKDELGDLLFQIVFYAQMGREAGLFDLNQIAAHVADKMIERHPHVFANREAADAQAVLANWEADKAKKREAAAGGKNPSALDGVNTALPAMQRAVKLQVRAARVGFDWPNVRDVFAKIREEIDELEVEVREANIASITDELGDVLFALTNLARHLDIEPEQALRGTNRKFERRFREVESRLAAYGKKPTEATLEEMEALWREVKRGEPS